MKKSSPKRRGTQPKRAPPAKPVQPAKSRKKTAVYSESSEPLVQAKRAEATLPAPVTVYEVAKPVVVKERGSVFPMTIVFIAIIAVLPLLIDYVTQLIAKTLGTNAAAYVLARRWLVEVFAYVPIYVLTLFYLKTTFNSLRFYGYKWTSEYLGWAVYLGIGSGIIIYLMDSITGIELLGVEPFSITVLLGYTLGFVILPALTEETIFRGVIQNFYQRRLTDTWSRYHLHIGILIASAFEIAFHLAVPMYYGATGASIGSAIITHLPQAAYVLVFGVIGGILYQRTGSLVGPIVIHALGNFTELVLIWAFH